MKPTYIKTFLKKMEADYAFEKLESQLDWLSVTQARKEYFMADENLVYNYSNRDYQSKEYHPVVKNIQSALNANHYNYNVCFLNRYDSYRDALGFHQDDSPEMNHDHPIAVISLGQEREIVWKHESQKGELPTNQKIMLKHGSLFLMPSGFQREFWHKIPRHHSQECGVRISLTFRNYLL